MAIEDVYALLDAFEGVDTTGVREAIGTEFATVTEGAQARIAELETALNESEKALTDMKARNFDLMTAATTKVEDGEDEDTETDKTYEVDDLFEEED